MKAADVVGGIAGVVKYAQSIVENIDVYCSTENGGGLIESWRVY